MGYTDDKLKELQTIKKSLNEKMFVLESEAESMAETILYHGTPDQMVKPAFGLGNDKHDYGRGFYLTEDYELAKEWAVCRPDETNGWVHKYELETAGLKILDFQTMDVLCWLAELMKHRDSSRSQAAG